jgi:hypothetical protein
MATQNELQGGNTTSPNRAPAAKVIAGALANNRVAQALIAALGSDSVFAIVATSTSTTVNFTALQVGDILVHVPATAGNTSFETVTAAGTKPSAAVVGDLYVGLRIVNLDANNPIVPAGGQLTGRTTGDGGLEF